MNVSPEDVYRAVDLTAVLVNGFLGGAVARQMRFDPVGFVVLGIVSALGGGMLRDTLLQQGQPIALTDPYYLLIAMGGTALAFLVHLQGTLSNRFVILADALGLGCWAAAGTVKALNFGLGPVPAVLLGVTTAVGGGMIRDVLVGRVPMIFGGNTLYATGAVIGACVSAACHSWGQQNLAMALSITTCAAVCLIARRRGWQLPLAVDFTATLSARQLQRVMRKGRQDI
ncbi:trimeric intracellular cation channel family protein [Micrococcales bacterium 31B]|nr:trimeric intracellular cation channel family protein [Micrococcales bacterium 31B]